MNGFVVSSSVIAFSMLLKGGFGISSSHVSRFKSFVENMCGIKLPHPLKSDDLSQEPSHNYLSVLKSNSHKSSSSILRRQTTESKTHTVHVIHSDTLHLMCVNRKQLKLKRFMVHDTFSSRSFYFPTTVWSKKR